MIESPPRSQDITALPPAAPHFTAIPPVEPLEVLPLDAPEPVGFLRATGRLIASVTQWLFGAASLVGGLAILAAIPIVQFLTLGYLLEAGGRVARTGRLRDGFIGVRKAARVGSIFLGTYLMLLPMWLLSSAATSAELIDPSGPVAQQWQTGMTILTVLMGLHIAAACARGGKLRYFLWPFNVVWLAKRVLRGGYYTEPRDAVWDFVVSLRLPYYFWLGFRGFVGAFVWLAIPVTLLLIGRQAPIVGFLGGLVMAIVVLYLPFLQIHFARTGRLRSMFEVRTVREQYQRAPVAFAFWFLITLAFAIPLYLLKIEMIPREAAWLPSVVFIAFIFPARLMTGWAVARADKSLGPRFFLFRWTGRPIMFAVALFYVLIVFFTQFTSWNGIGSLYLEQHVFQLPVPFMNLAE